MDYLLIPYLFQAVLLEIPSRPAFFDVKAYLEDMSGPGIA
jgi:hypothetical protein